MRCTEKLLITISNVFLILKKRRRRRRRGTRRRKEERKKKYEDSIEQNQVESWSFFQINQKYSKNVKIENDQICCICPVPTDRFLAVSSEKQASFAFAILLLEAMSANKVTLCKHNTFFTTKKVDFMPNYNKIFSLCDMLKQYDHTTQHQLKSGLFVRGLS